MNLAEKLAAAYLRLNGFFLLPHFTVFSGAQHSHVDLIALRCADSKECVGELCFPVDDKLFKALDELRGETAKASLVGLLAEVKTNNELPKLSNEHSAYVKNFFGGLQVSRIVFYDVQHDIKPNGDTLNIGIQYAGRWIQSRIDWMITQQLSLTKDGSWTWSESFLSDLLVLRKYGLISAGAAISATTKHEGS